jgi:hypothetical protein
MSIWEVDFYRRPLQDEFGNPLWELVICKPTADFRYRAFCPQSEATADWLILQLQQLFAAGQLAPSVLQVFRPQTLNLLDPVCRSLGLSLCPTRRTPTLKQYLLELAAQYPLQPGYINRPPDGVLGSLSRRFSDAIALDQPPPLPLAEHLWGNQWRFASLSAADLVESFRGRMIPILYMPESLLPINLGLVSTVTVPGVVIDGGRQSMQLARWIEQTNPVALNYMAGTPDGLILEAGLVDRWILETFDDPEVVQAAQNYETRKRLSKGLHFLLVRPDESGMTYSGFWLLNADF